MGTKNMKPHQLAALLKAAKAVQALRPLAAFQLAQKQAQKNQAQSRAYV